MDDNRERRALHIDGQALMYREKAASTHEVEVRDEYEALATLLEKTSRKLRKVTTIKKEVQVAKEFEKLIGEMLAKFEAKHDKPR
jgi:hypothetical protein